MRDWNTEFKTIRNRIRKYRQVPFVLACMEKLQEVEGQVESWRNWMPWYLALMIKWSLVHDLSPSTGRTPAQGDLGEVMNRLHQFGDRSDWLGPEAEHGVWKFMRTVAHQQFWWQRRLNRDDLGRAWLFFGDLPADHTVSQQFEAETGMTPAAFLESAFLLWGWALRRDRPRWLLPQNLSAKTSLSQAQVEQFLKLLSISPPSARGTLAGHRRRVENPSLQLLERTPLVRHPLLEHEGRFWPFSTVILEECIRSFVFDLLRDRCPNDFSQVFGPRFEAHLRRGLELAEIRFVDESSLKIELGAGKLVDYLIPGSAATVLVEAKATELSPLSRANPATPRLASELRSSVVKAVLQAFEVAHRLTRFEDKLEVPNREGFILVVVTYNPLYLWSGGATWDELLAATVLPELKERGIEPSLIPPGRIFFVDVGEWDQLMAVVAQGSADDGVAKLLLDAETKNGGPHTARFTLGLHLRDAYEAAAPVPYLQAATASLTDRVRGRFAPVE